MEQPSFQSWWRRWIRSRRLPPRDRPLPLSQPLPQSRLLPLGLLLAGGGCGALQLSRPVLEPPMPVPPPLRKQVLKGYMPFGSIGWVNNEQVVFHGVPKNSSANRKSLYLWDLRGKPQELLKRSHSSCVSMGTIHTSQLREKRQPQGFTLSSPDFAPHPRNGKQAPTRSKFDQVSCSWIATPEALVDREWEPLRKGDGFLIFSQRLKDTAIQQVDHLAADQESLKSTGIHMEPPMLPVAVHAAHDNSYLVFDLNQTPSQRERWINTDNRVIWRLTSQLRGTPIQVPAGTWVNPVGGSLAFLDARAGLLITSNNFARNREAGGAGLYLLPPGGAAQRLERGLVENPAVSPNGCRIAYGFRPRLDTGIPEGGPRLVILDLCPEKSAGNR